MERLPVRSLLQLVQLLDEFSSFRINGEDETSCNSKERSGCTVLGVREQ